MPKHLRRGSQHKTSCTVKHVANTVDSDYDEIHAGVGPELAPQRSLSQRATVENPTNSTTALL